MARNARVESIEGLRKFRVALCKFAETVRAGLDETEAEVQRTSFWLKQEQYNYWKGQAAKRAELYARAKSELTRKKGQKTPLGGRYSCVEEEKALAAAERKLAEAKQKLANVQRWNRQLDDERYSTQGVILGMSQATEVDIPVALAQLDNMITALEAYATAGPPSAQRSVAATAAAATPASEAGAASMARDRKSVV